MDFKKIMGLFKPVITIVLGVIGYVFACNGFDRNIFLAIVVLSFILRGGAIIRGFVELYRGIFKKE